MKIRDLSLAHAPSPAFALCCFVGGVEFGIYGGGQFSFEAGCRHFNSHILSIQIFDSEREFRWRDGQESGILVTDSTSEEYIDEDMFLFGEAYEKYENGVITLRDRGVRKQFRIPLPVTSVEDVKYLRLRVRNYICYDGNGMAYVKNYRLAGLYYGRQDGNLKEIQPSESNYRQG